jgi:hypothetical protein
MNDSDEFLFPIPAGDILKAFRNALPEASYSLSRTIRNVVGFYCALDMAFTRGTVADLGAQE